MNQLLNLVVIAIGFAASTAATAQINKKGEPVTFSAAHQATLCGKSDVDIGLAFGEAVSKEIDRRLKGGAKSVKEAVRSMNVEYCGRATGAREDEK